MSKPDRLRRGVERLIELDCDIGTVTRYIKADNGRGQYVPTGETSSHKISCRVSYQAGGVWPGRQWEGGLTVDSTPYVFSYHNANVEQGDILEWRGRKYTVGTVSKPEFAGGSVCVQAPITEVK